MRWVTIDHPLTFDGRASRSSGLALWSTARYHYGFFRYRLWDRGGTVRQVYNRLSRDPRE